MPITYENHKIYKKFEPSFGRYLDKYDPDWTLHKKDYKPNNINLNLEIYDEKILEKAGITVSKNNNDKIDSKVAVSSSKCWQCCAKRKRWFSIILILLICLIVTAVFVVIYLLVLRKDNYYSDGISDFSVTGTPDQQHRPLFDLSANDFMLGKLHEEYDNYHLFKVSNELNWSCKIQNFENRTLDYDCFDYFKLYYNKFGHLQIANNLDFTEIENFCGICLDLDQTLYDRDDPIKVLLKFGLSVAKTNTANCDYNDSQENKMLTNVTLCGQVVPDQNTGVWDYNCYDSLGFGTSYEIYDFDVTVAFQHESTLGSCENEDAVGLFVRSDIFDRINFTFT